MTVDKIVFAYVLLNSYLGPNFIESNDGILICQFHVYYRTCSVVLLLNMNTLSYHGLC
jgi:hypothetical protein